MNQFIQNPNLPNSEVTAIVISGVHNRNQYYEQYCEIYNNLEKRNISLVKTNVLKELAWQVCYHPDMQCHHLGGSQIVVAKNNKYLFEQFEQLGMRPSYSYKELNNNYPQDIPLNAARIDRVLFAHLPSLDTAISDFCLHNDIKMLSVHQGYSKCSTAIVSKDAVITSDKMIYDTAVQSGLQALKICSGYIELPGYNYGFIGGTCGLIDKHKLAFTGNIKFHPDYKAIKDFLEKQNVEIICLTEGCLLDIGGILPILENN